MKRKFKCDVGENEVLQISTLTAPGEDKHMEFYVLGTDESVVLHEKELKMLYEMIGAELRK